MIHNEAFENPRVIVIQKLYSHHLNKDSEITFPKHRYKKFKNDINNNKTELMIKLMIMAAIYEFMYMHKTPVKVIITEYLKVSDFFVQSAQKDFLNAILDKVSKISRLNVS